MGVSFKIGSLKYTAIAVAVTVLAVVCQRDPASADALYWSSTSTNTISRMVIEGDQVFPPEVVVPNVPPPPAGWVGVAVDPVCRSLYWATGATLFRANLDGTDPDAITNFPLAANGYTRDLEAHVAGNRVYASALGVQAILGANPTSGFVERLSISLNDHAVAIDKENGKLYWMEQNTRRIMRSNLDGTEIEDVAPTEGGGTGDIALDPIGGKLYWTRRQDSGSGNIRRADLDGANAEDVLFRQLYRPEFIDVDPINQKIYWTERNTSEQRIVRSNMDGSEVEILYTVSGGAAEDVAFLSEGGAGSSAPIVIQPDAGGNAGSVTVQIFTRFEEGSVIKLQREGEDDIVAAGVSQINNLGVCNTVSAVFDLRNQTLGKWNVIIDYPDGSSSRLSEGFTITEGGVPRVRVGVVGPSFVRPNQTTQFTVFVTNTGDADAIAVPLWIAAPEGADINPLFEISQPQFDGDDSVVVPDKVNVNSDSVIPLLIPVLPATSASAYTVSLTPQSLQNPVSPFPIVFWSGLPLVDTATNINGNLSPIFNAFSLQCIADIFKLISPLDCAEVSGEAIGNIAFDIINNETFIVNNPENQLIWLADFAKACTPVLGKFKRVEIAINTTDAILTGVNLAENCFNEAREQKVVMTTTSSDPNNKFGYLNNEPQNYVSGRQPLAYTVQFENLETAGAAAQQVIVTDQLEIGEVDLNSLQLGPIKFGEREIVPPPSVSTFGTDVDLRPDNNLIVRIATALNQTSGLVSWRFKSLDPDTGLPTTDPLAGFLPPNVNPPEGDGSVSFTIMPKDGLATGTEVLNDATIIFDANEPITTPVWLNTIDNDLPESAVVELDPTQTSESFTVAWSGEDIGAGVRDFTIFVAENNGPFIPWLANTTETSALFSGENGKLYDFYSIARDGAGNVEEAPEFPDTTTAVEATQAEPPLAGAGTDRTEQCTSATATSVTLDGSASTDPDGNSLTYAWSGPFPEGSGTATGEAPTVTLPLGTSSISLVVNNGSQDSEPDTVDITVAAGVGGFFSPLAALVPEGETPQLANNAFKQGRTLPLKVALHCGGTTLTDFDVSPPQIVTLQRTSDATDLPVNDLDAGGANDSGSLFRFSDDQWIYNLSTKSLSAGDYEITIEMPDGLRYVAAFVLR